MARRRDNAVPAVSHEPAFGAALLKRAYKPQQFTGEGADRVLAADGIPTDILARLKPLRSKSFPSAEELLTEAGKILTDSELQRCRAPLLRYAAGYHASSELENMLWLMVARSASEDEWRQEALGSLTATILAAQHPDGHWEPGRGRHPCAS